MTDKSFIIENAREYAKKGKIDKAIAEWSKLLTFSRDGHICNNIGDLYIKKEAQDEAIEFFTKAAKIFKKNGFDTKAIAIYNKILTLEPDRLDIVDALTNLHIERGLPGKALEDIFRIAETLSKEGNTKKALKVLESALSIAPSDTQIKEKIDVLSQKLSTEEETGKQWKNKLHWGRGWSAFKRTSKKIKTRKKTVWSSVIRAAVFALAAIAVLTLTFGDGERVSDDVMIEVSLMSSADGDNKQRSSSYEEELLDDELIEELNELLKDDSTTEKTGKAVGEDTTATESEIILQDGNPAVSAQEMNPPETSSGTVAEEAEEETVNRKSAVTAQDGILFIPMREENTNESSAGMVDTDTATAAPEMKMQGTDMPESLQEDNTPEIKKEAVKQKAIAPEPAAVSVDKESELTGKVNERPVEDRSVSGTTSSKEEDMLTPDVKHAEKLGHPSVFKEKKLVAYEELFNDNAHNWEIFATSMASASIENGKFYLENKSEKGVYIALSSHDFPGDADFITEASISTERSTGNHSYGLVYGFKDANNYYAFKISAGGFFSIGKYHQGVFQKLIGGKAGESAIHKNRANTLKLEKEGNSIRFYINNFFLNEVSSLSFPGSKSGFIVEGKIKIAVHKSLSYVWF